MLRIIDDIYLYIKFNDIIKRDMFSARLVKLIEYEKEGINSLLSRVGVSDYINKETRHNECKGLIPLLIAVSLSNTKIDLKELLNNLFQNNEKFAKAVHSADIMDVLINISDIKRDDGSLYIRIPFDDCYDISADDMMVVIQIILNVIRNNLQDVEDVDQVLISNYNNTPRGETSNKSWITMLSYTDGKPKIKSVITNNDYRILQDAAKGILPISEIHGIIYRGCDSNGFLPINKLGNKQLSTTERLNDFIFRYVDNFYSVAPEIAQYIVIQLEKRNK